MLGLVHQPAEFLEPGPQLIADVPPDLARGLAVGLDEGLANGGGDNRLLRLWHVGQRIAHKVHATALPCRADDPLDGGLQSFVRVRDHELDAAQAASGQALQEVRPEVSASDGPMPSPTISRRPSVLAATATIAATETMRPPSRTFR